VSTKNWSDLIKDAGDTGSYEPLPDGDFDLLVVEATATTSQSGKTMFKVKAQVEGGPYNKRLVWDNLVVTPESPAALGMLFKKFHAMGIGRNYFDTNPSNAQIEATLTGRRFRAQIGSRMYNGAKKNEIRNYFPSAATIAAMQGDTAAPVQSEAPASPPPAAAPAPAPAPVAAAPAPAPAPAAPSAPF
jgi:hypothetical protein